MSQNEQNKPVRSRDAQEDSLAYHLGGLQAADNFRLLARAMIAEAEDRGAAEQRRKDADKWAATQLLSASKIIEDKNANVAVLEARIAELEAERDSLRGALIECGLNASALLGSGLIL
ncbi:hypothetical protein HKD21_14115 [Gluconobacter cerevisiae]|uniref:Transposase n=1 Tax=Gluconobacter cerevisiae TaxID=1379734 RepID=A0ABR9YH79_9PROT|nr:hypothetical protein [Gluconobacter cerevisiae]MBF0877961.1 hypothetical protein [Gluconobacter cerevisiae]